MNLVAKQRLRALFLRGYEIGLAMRAPRHDDAYAPDINQDELRAAIQKVVGARTGNDRCVLTADEWIDRLFAYDGEDHS